MVSIELIVVLAALTTSLLGAPPTVTSSGRDSGSGCHAFDLVEQVEQRTVPASLGWTSSAVWRGSELLVADTAFRRMARIAVGSHVRQEMTELPFTTDSMLPARVVAPFFIAPRAPSGYLLLDIEGSGPLYFVNEQDEIEDMFLTRGQILHSTDGSDVRLTGVYQMASLGGGVVAASDLASLSGDRKWSSFLYLDRGNAKNQFAPLQVALSEELEDLVEKFYSRDLSYLAVVDDIAYILMLEHEPWIGWVRKGDREVQRLGIPARQGLEMPQLTVDVDAIGSHTEMIDWLFKIYRAIETHRMPAGIYSWQGKLLLLVKSAVTENGETSWELLGISREDGRQLGPGLVLPTRAHHLTLVPGADYFAVIEKGLSRSWMPFHEDHCIGL